MLSAHTVCHFGGYTGHAQQCPFANEFEHQEHQEQLSSRSQREPVQRRRPVHKESQGAGAQHHAALHEMGARWVAARRGAQAARGVGKRLAEVVAIGRRADMPLLHDLSCRIQRRRPARARCEMGARWVQDGCKMRAGQGERWGCAPGSRLSGCRAAPPRVVQPAPLLTRRSR